VFVVDVCAHDHDWVDGSVGKPEMQFGLSELADHANGKVEAREVSDYDRLSEAAVGIEQCLFDPLPGLDALCPSSLR
jgi:hypothetical protein